MKQCDACFRITYADAYFFLVTAMAKDGVEMRIPLWPEDYHEWDEPEVANAYVIEPEFELELRRAKQALASGDLDTVTDLVIEVAARSKAQRIRGST